MTELSKDLAGFGTQLGKMIANNQAKSPADAKKAQQAAQNELESVATKIRQTTAKAQDPELRAAGAQAADQIDKTASSKQFYDSIKDVKNVDTSLQSEMVSWLTPLSNHCG